MNKKRSGQGPAGEKEKYSKKRKGFSFSNNSDASKEKRYRFKNFNDRIEDIDISSIQSIGGYRGAGPVNTDSTWFELSLNEWKELNCSASFAKFCYAVTPMTGTLAKLLFNRERIVKEIFEVLKNSNKDGPESPNRLALVPVLSLTAMLAKDLGSEFHCHFAEFFQLLLPILPSTSDPEIIEAAFASLLYVFKCILTDLLNDLPGTFETVVKPLVNCPGQLHLRRFGAQCFGYVLRKSLKISGSGFFEVVESEDDSKIKEFVADSFVAAILDESTGRFRSCLKGLLLEIAGYLKLTKSQSVWSDILRYTTVKLLEVSDLNRNGPLWKIFIELLEDSENNFISHVLIDAFAFRRGSRVQFQSLLFPGLIKFRSIEICVHLMRSMDLEITLMNRQSTLSLIESVIGNDFKNLLALCRGLVAVGWSHYDLILSDLVRSFVSVCDEPILIIELLEVLLPKYSTASSSLSSITAKVLCCLVSSDDTLSLRALKILIDYIPASYYTEEFVLNNVNKFEGMIKSKSFGSRDELILWTEVISTKKVSVKLTIEEITEFINEVPLLYPEQLKAVQVALISIVNFELNAELIMDIALQCLRSHSPEWRQQSLDLIALIYKNDTKLAELIQILLQIESIPSDLENYREKLLQLRKLEHLRILESDAGMQKLSISHSLIINYLIGFIQIKMTLLWPEGFRILSKFASDNTELFSSLMKELFTKIIAQQETIKHCKGPEEIKSLEESYTYDFEIGDSGLNNLKKIHDIIYDYEHNKNIICVQGIIVPFQDTSILIPSILKLFALHPDACLSQDYFRENIFLPLIISTFSDPDGANKLIQSNLGAILQALAGIKLEASETAKFKNDQIEQLLLRFLSHGDLQLQNRALDALFNTKKYGNALSNQWKNRVKSLLNDNLFREELTNLTSEAESLPKIVHWHNLLAPLIVKILFGRFIARKGASAGRHSLPLRRKMIMNCFGTWDEDSMALIVEFLLSSSKGESKQQIGLLNVLEDVFGSLGRKLDEESMKKLIKLLMDLYIQSDKSDDLNCLIQDQLMELESIDQLNSIETTSADPDNVGNDHTKDDQRRMKQLIMKRLVQLFKLFEFSAMKNFRPFLNDMFNSILNPRIDQLSTHFTNSITSSSLIEILVCISSNCSDVEIKEILTVWSPKLWENAVEAFGNQSAKPLVVSQLLSFFEGIIIGSMKKSEELTSLLISRLDSLLDAIDSRLQSSNNFHVTMRIVALVQVICPYVSSPDQASRLCKTFEGMLKVKTINESIRTHLISALAELITKASKASLSRSLFEIASAQWNILNGRPGRESLCLLFECFAKLTPDNMELTELSLLLRDLNSWLPGRLSEPNFDLRLAAFAKLRRLIDSRTLSSSGTFDAFVPIAWSMIYFLQDADELSIRNQSFGVLKTLIKSLTTTESTNIVDQSPIISLVESEVDDDGIEIEIENEKSVEIMSIHNISAPPILIQRIILPAIKKGLKSRLEIIRIEFVSLFDLLISTFPSKHPFDSLYALICPLGDQDGTFDLDEENIFRNIYHIQEPRRTRAIRLIGELATNGKLTGLTRGLIEDLLLPLIISTALPDPRGEIAFEVSEAMQKDSITTCGSLMAQLPSKAFLRKLGQFVKEVSENNRSEQWNRSVLRLLPAMISQFKLSTDNGEFSAKVDEDILPAMFRLLHKSESAGESEKPRKVAKTSSSGPTSDKISVKTSLRVPIAISIGQLIKLVSNGQLESPIVLSYLPRLLTDLLNVLKQKDAETRDVARGALVKIMGAFGTPYLPFLLKEARTLLNRGYQRHVLTFTAHAILVEFLRLHKLESIGTNSVCNLDASAELLVDMALASSFGFQAAERTTIEWSGKQPEVRAFKGPEIIALTAQFTSQNVLEKSVIQKVTKIALLELDDSVGGMLNTRGTGALDEKAEAINRIEGESFDLLLKSLFLNGLYPLLAREPDRFPEILAVMYKILEYPCDSGSRSHLHRLQSRVFEFISHVLNHFKINDSDFIGRIIPFIGLTKEYILERGKHADALTSAITLFNQFIAYKSLHSYIIDLQPLLQKLFSIILKGNSGNAEGSVQLSAAFKLTSTLIRDWPDLDVSDTQIKALIEYTRLQLENTHQQSLTFALIRSLISRQIVLLQLFELMDTIRTTMLTSHHTTTRQQCRSAFVHFLTNYPMATKKLEEQLDFLLANVRYEFATGRESCIEVMNNLIMKLPIEVVEGIAESWFVGLAVQLAKENSSDGSIEVAEVILKTISVLFSRLPLGKRRDNLELLLLRWILQSPKLSVQGAAWKIFLPILKELSVLSRDKLLEKAVELMSDDSTPEDLLRIVVKSVDESIKNEICSENNLNSIVVEASNQKFFKDDYELSTRHSIALLWNSLLNSN